MEVIYLTIEKKFYTQKSWEQFFGLHDDLTLININMKVRLKKKIVSQ